MHIAVPKETHPGENRVPITPDTAKKLVRLGADLQVEAGMGEPSGFTDAEYEQAGATVVAVQEEDAEPEFAVSPKTILREGTTLLMVGSPTSETAFSERFRD